MKPEDISAEDLEKYKEFRTKNNKFGHLMGYRIVDMKVGYAKVELPVREEFFNPVGSVHGGVIFSLADTTTGTCAASYGIKMTTMNASFNFLAPAMKSKLLTGEAFEIKHGQTVNVIDCKITDDTGRLIASGTFTFFSLGVPLIGDEISQEFKDIDVPGIPKNGIITDHGTVLPVKEGQFPHEKGTAV